MNVGYSPIIDAISSPDNLVVQTSSITIYGRGFSVGGNTVVFTNSQTSQQYSFAGLGVRLYYDNGDNVGQIQLPLFDPATGQPEITTGQWTVQVINAETSSLSSGYTLVVN